MDWLWTVHCNVRRVSFRYLQLRPSVTDDLQARIDQFYQYKWAMHGGVEGDQNLFDDLHPRLRLVHCAGMGVQALKMTASERRSF